MSVYLIRNAWLGDFRVKRTEGIDNCLLLGVRVIRVCLNEDGTLNELGYSDSQAYHLY